MFLNFSNNPRPCFFVLSFLLSPTYAHFPPLRILEYVSPSPRFPFSFLIRGRKKKKRCKNCLSRYSTSLHVSEARSVKGVGSANKLQEEIKRGKKKKKKKKGESRENITANLAMEIEFPGRKFSGDFHRYVVTLYNEERFLW